MDLEFIISIISITLAVISILLSLWINWKRIKLANYTLSLRILQDMVKEYRNPDFKKHRDFITDRLSGIVRDPSKGFSELDPDSKLHVTTVMHFIDHLGCILVANKQVNDKYVISFIGESIENLWKILEPYIQYERNKRKNPYFQGYFQELVYRVRKTDLTKLRKKQIHDLNKK